MSEMNEVDIAEFIEKAGNRKKRGTGYRMPETGGRRIF